MKLTNPVNFGASQLIPGVGPIPKGNDGNGVTPLWRCPKCDARFTTRNQQHSCGQFHLAELFAHSTPRVRRLYAGFVRLVRSQGRVIVIPQKTRVAFQVRMRFAAVTPLRSCLRGHLVLGARHEGPCFLRVESLSPRNLVHHFRLESEEQLTPELARWVREAYKVGRQEHLRRRRAAQQGDEADER
jgi:Domain of unknown function (DUF5655)